MFAVISISLSQIFNMIKASCEFQGNPNITLHNYLALNEFEFIPLGIIQSGRKKRMLPRKHVFFSNKLVNKY